MRLRNGEHGYGVVTKTLHWMTFVALVAQFAVGYLMDPDAEFDRADDDLDARDEACKAESDAGEAEEERCEEQVEREEDALKADEDDGWAGEVFTDLTTGQVFDGGLTLPETHVLLGLLILGLALVRVVWRASTPLPPWAPHLSAGERSLESALEKTMLVLLFLVPGSGLLLAAGTGSLALHIASHLTFYAVLALHIGLVLRHTVVRPHRHLARML